MTDPRPEQVEALVLEVHDGRLHRSRGGADDDLARTACVQHGLEPCRNLVTLFMSAAIAASMRLVPAEVADIGEAVQRLPRMTVGITQHADGEWTVTSLKPPYLGRATAPSLPEAIAAALEDKS